MSRRGWSGSIGLCVTRDGEELYLVVSGSISAFAPARLHGHPDTWAPAEGGDVEIAAIALDERGSPKWGGVLTDDEEAEARELLQEKCDEDGDTSEGPPDRDDDDRDDYPCPEAAGW